MRVAWSKSQVKRFKISKKKTRHENDTHGAILQYQKCVRILNDYLKMKIEWVKDDFRDNMKEKKEKWRIKKKRRVSDTFLHGRKIEILYFKIK